MNEKLPQKIKTNPLIRLALQ